MKPDDSVLRFWDVLQEPRYAFWSFDDNSTLEELMEDLWRKTLEAWCPGGPASVREHLALTVERMARATREAREVAATAPFARPSFTCGVFHYSHSEFASFSPAPTSSRP
ncbi:hypothetical protein [Archangium violaceum]|uniref:hypothetical protein n=1 Tax=Archangium violaceum TaxID=83451 RepID=UPI001EF54ADE|nr:hypothetical protein [Archangium violaceum]